MSGITADVLQAQKSLTKKGRVYLSGPMTGLPLFNFPAFAYAARKLRREGWDVVNPAEMDEQNGWATVKRSDDGDIIDVQTTPAFNFATAIKADRELIDGCDAIYLLRGWSKSLGAGIERDHALVQGKEILFAPDAELPDPREPEHVLTTPDFIIRTPGYVSPRIEFNRSTQDRVRDAGMFTGPLPAADEGIYEGVDDDPFTDALRLVRQGHVDAQGHADRVAQALETVKPDDGIVTFQIHRRPAPNEGLGLEGEVRVVSATGGAKGSKLARFDMIPPDVLWELAEHYGKGEAKYPSDADGKANWQKGYAWHLSVAALLRHLTAWLQGENDDDETGSNHLVAVAWHAFALRWFQIHDAGTDNLQGRAA